MKIVMSYSSLMSSIVFEWATCFLKKKSFEVYLNYTFIPSLFLIFLIYFGLVCYNVAYKLVE